MSQKIQSVSEKKSNKVEISGNIFDAEPLLKSLFKKDDRKTKLNRKMGYISTIKEAKKSLEKLYNNS